MVRTKGKAVPLPVRRKPRKPDPPRRARAKARTDARQKRIAEILERTRKARAILDERMCGAEYDPTPVMVPWHNGDMLRDEEATIEVAETLYAQVATRADRNGMKAEVLFDILVNKALDRADQHTHEAIRDGRSKVLCDCCKGLCKNVLTWRGRTRCGCPNVSVKPLATGKNA